MDVVSEKKSRKLEPRFYKAVGATGPQSDKAFPALARRRAQGSNEKFADSQEIAKKVTDFYAGTAPTKIVKEKEEFFDEDYESKVSWLQPPVSAKIASAMILVIPLIFGLLDVLLTGQVGVITSFAYSITLLYLAFGIDKRHTWDPVLAGPISYFFVILVLGQLVLSNSGALWLREVAMILTTLAFNAPWIVGSTLIAFGISFIRIRKNA